MSFTPANAVVWAEIPVTDLDKAMEFYSAVFQFTLTINDMGPNPMADISYQGGTGVSGHLYPGKPAMDGNGPTIHLAVPGTVEEAVERLNAAGGKSNGFVIEIPPGRFAYATDPDGNSLGLFQPAK